MSPARLALFFALAIPCLCWASVALSVTRLQLSAQPILDALQHQSALPPAAERAQSLARYERMMRHVPCQRTLHQGRLLLLAQATDDALHAPDLDAGDRALAAMEGGLRASLACNSMDGKTWLDLATIRTIAEGYGPRAQEAYLRSAEVAPGEAWLAESRLKFAVKYAPFLDAQARAVAARDLEVLTHAAGFRTTNVMRAALATTPAALAERFADAPARAALPDSQ